MAHLSLDELRDVLDTAAQQVTVGGKYRHYKGQTYTVAQLAIIEETNEAAVVYSADYAPDLIFVRPVSVWLETVKHDGRLVPRFALITGGVT